MDELRLLQIVNFVAIIAWIVLASINISRARMSSVEATLKPENVAAQALECLPAASRGKQQRTKKGPRTKTPDDCPHCCGSAIANTEVRSNNAAHMLLATGDTLPAFHYILPLLLGILLIVRG